MKIIIVDDEKSILNSLVDILSEKYYVVGYSSSKLALEKIKSETFDLAILDYLIDEMNGKDLLSEIRKFNANIKVMMLTAYPDQLDPFKSLDKMPIEAYVIKSSNIKGIHLSIESMIKTITSERVKNVETLTLGEKLKILREKNRVSLKQLADYCDIKPQAVANWESNYTKPTIDGLKKVAEFFNVSLDDLMSHKVNILEK